MNAPTPTWTTYSDDEAITWQVVGGIARAVKVERDAKLTTAATEPSSDCPTCGATGSKRCRTRTGNILTVPHIARADFETAQPREARIAEIVDLDQQGLDFGAVCATLRVDRRALTRWMQRNGMEEVYLRLRFREEDSRIAHTRRAS